MGVSNTKPEPVYKVYKITLPEGIFWVHCSAPADPQYFAFRDTKGYPVYEKTIPINYGTDTSDSNNWVPWAWTVIIEILHDRYEHCLVYSSVSDSIVAKSPPAAAEKRNNDGRLECYKCGAPTRRIQSIITTYDVCTKCGA